MTKFTAWCTTTEKAVSAHKLQHVAADASKIAKGVQAVAKALPDYYATPSRVSKLLADLGKPAVARYVAEKLPTAATIRSGDLGEILCHSYVLEATPYSLGIRRLRWKDHRNMSMRGEDLLAFNVNGTGKLSILKAESKSRAKMSSSVIDEARTALSANAGLPSPHALSFVADRLDDPVDAPLRDALDRAQLVDGVATSQVSHMLFTFSGNDPSALLAKNLATYAGKVRQHYVGLEVDKHQNFIKEVFEAVSA